MFTKNFFYYFIFSFNFLSITSSFGHLDTTLYSFTLDINGDKIVDSCKVKLIDSLDCSSNNLYKVDDDGVFESDTECKSDTQFILDILMSNKKEKKHNRCTLYNKAFFDALPTPSEEHYYLVKGVPSVWSDKKRAPISVLTYNNTKGLEKECGNKLKGKIMGDVIVIFTESSYKYYLYFDGKEFRVLYEKYE